MLDFEFFLIDKSRISFDAVGRMKRHLVINVGINGDDI